MWLSIVLLVAVMVTALVVPTVVARRRGHPVGGVTIVRCRKGHLFSTIWVPGVSLKAVRLGRERFQHCPVGRHWTLVVPVKEDDLTDDERRLASENRDPRVL